MKKVLMKFFIIGISLVSSFCFFVHGQNESLFVQELETDLKDLKREYSVQHDVRQSLKKAFELELKLIAFYVMEKNSWNSDLESLSHRIHVTSINLERKLSNFPYSSYEELSMGQRILSYYILGYFREAPDINSMSELWGYLLKHSETSEEILRKKLFPATDW